MNEYCNILAKVGINGFSEASQLKAKMDKDLNLSRAVRNGLNNILQMFIDYGSMLANSETTEEVKFLRDRDDELRNGITPNLLHIVDRAQSLRYTLVHVSDAGFPYTEAQTMISLKDSNYIQRLFQDLEERLKEKGVQREVSVSRHARKRGRGQGGIGQNRDSGGSGSDRDAVDSGRSNSP